MPNSAAPGPWEFYKSRFEVENNLTHNILKAISPDKLDYRPPERSPSTGQIAWTIVRGVYVRVDMAAKASSDVITSPPPSLAEILDRFEDTSCRHSAQLESFPAEQWIRVGQLRVGDRVALKQKVFGYSTSTRSIIAVGFAPIYGPWVRRSHRFTARRVTRGFHKGSGEGERPRGVNPKNETASRRNKYIEWSEVWICPDLSTLAI